MWKGRRQLRGWKFSHKETLKQTSFDRSWILLAKPAKSRFVPPFGGLRCNVYGSSMARWKARGRLPSSANWTFFASSHSWGAINGYWSKSLFSKWGWSLWAQISGGMKVAHQRRLASEYYSLCDIMWRCLPDLTFSHFDTTLECDRQTHRQTHDDS